MFEHNGKTRSGILREVIPLQKKGIEIGQLAMLVCRGGDWIVDVSLLRGPRQPGRKPDPAKQAAREAAKKRAKEKREANERRVAEVRVKYSAGKSIPELHAEYFGVISRKRIKRILEAAGWNV